MCVHFKCISYDALIHKPQGSEANKSPEMCCFANWALLQTAHFIKSKKTAFCINSESPSLYQGSFSQEEKWHCFSDVHLIIVHGWWRPNNDVMPQCMCLVFKSYNHLKSSFIGWCNGPVTWDTFEQPLTSFFFFICMLAVGHFTLRVLHSSDDIPVLKNSRFWLIRSRWIFYNCSSDTSTGGTVV